MCALSRNIFKNGMNDEIHKTIHEFTIRYSSFFVMSFIMLYEVLLNSKACTANTADETFLCVMSQLVSLQISHSIEFLSTCVTHVFGRVCMSLHVHFQ